MKRLFISSLETCAGCRTCELLCSFRHEKEINPELSRIKVVKLPLGDIPDVIAEPVFCVR
jgi:Fe-S-cluster-containing hydrogenase component 2